MEDRRGHGVKEFVKAVRGQGDAVLGLVSNSGSVILKGESDG